jgi:uncharacterized iron-regulated membrane protein
MPETEMTLGEQWKYRPQNVWLRKALFQVHLWVGIGLGIYVLLISLSGSAIVFRNEISKAFSSAPRIVPVSGTKLSHDDLKQAVRRAYPQYSVSYIWDSKRPDEATEVWILHGNKNKMRLFDPYTGQDLGDSVPLTLRALTFAIDLHVNLLSGRTGRVVNGVGAILTTLLVITGAVVWWPGVQTWRKSLILRRESNWKKFNWSLHSAIGVWTLAFVLLWGVTGIFVVFPTPFEQAVNFFSPLQFYRLDYSAPPVPQALPPSAQPGANRGSRRLPPIQRSPGDQFIRWLYYLHFGNFAGSGTKAIWVLFGFAPVVLFITGVLMWWNRVLSKLFERKPKRRYEIAPATLRSSENQVASS